MEEFIQLKKRNTLKFGLRDENGVEKKDEFGNLVYIEFDLEDIELPLKYNKCEWLVRKAQQDLKWKFITIDKKQDINKNKMIMSKNDEDKANAIKDYYNDMEKAIDLFLGDGGTKKIFGTKKYYDMFDDLAEMLEPILPKLQIKMEDITNKIKDKYKNTQKNVLKNE